MKLDKNQINSIKAEGKNILVVAAPGSGKTTVIINRVNYLVNTLNIQDFNIIVITFTKAAALNMKNRYLNTLVDARILYTDDKSRNRTFFYYDLLNILRE